ncbi:nudix hydrolase [Leptolyngbya sp. Heron Island J]|uniref:NUDIX hydrolase n=1 Tax=Leptolyngbya sp. Heron Island J TaxID=1385935 RepID=UPI0003B95DFB|nr:NUDIX hydrolase [Leptolyngbya sp. Heron Island J]ESA38168.1 nudix hydrolase [Leptolyngbya sp. Heron Island J]
MSEQPWQFQETILSLQTGWLTLLGEKLKTPQGERLDYWRVEKADSVIVLPVHRQHLLLPPPVYRPGVGQSTWDFPGGRCPDGQSLQCAATTILERELGVADSGLSCLSPINQTGWPINSSFSNQRLHGFVAEIKPDVSLVPEKLGATYPLTHLGIQSLLDRLICLQCRGLFMEWWMAEGDELRECE